MVCWWGSCGWGAFWVFSRGTNDDYDYDDGTRIQRMKRINTDLRRILKTSGHVALIAEPERGPHRVISVNLRLNLRGLVDPTTPHHHHPTTTSMCWLVHCSFND